MTAQGMGVEGNGQQRLAGSPDGNYHFRVNARMMRGTSTWSSVVG